MLVVLSLINVECTQKWNEGVLGMGMEGNAITSSEQ